MLDKEFIKTFHNIHEMLMATITDKAVREYTRDFNAFLMEAIEFYEKEVGTDCKFYKAGIKQMAMDIARQKPQVVEEAVSLLRERCTALLPSTDVRGMSGGDIQEGGS